MPEEIKHIELPCIVEKVIFQKDNGFAILACTTNAFSVKYNVQIEDDIKKHLVVSKYGNFIVTTGMLDPGTSIEGKQVVFLGDYVENKKFGNQFKSEFYYVELVKTVDGLKAFLQGIPHIKAARSKAIIDKYGVEGTIDVLDNNPNELLSINGITEKRIKPIKEAWDKERMLMDLCIFLGDRGVPPKLAKKIYDKWNSESMDIVENDPYRIAEINGIGFETADTFAHKVLKDIPKEARLKACMHYVLLEDVYKNSNLCTPYPTLKQRILELLKKCNQRAGKIERLSDYNGLIAPCIKNNLNVFTAAKDVVESPESNTYVYLKEILDKEVYVARALYNRQLVPVNMDAITDEDLEGAEEDIKNFSGFKIQLDDCQKKAIKSAFENKITIITGGGGTGKSTICRCIYHLAQEKNLHVRMMSPTGKAAKVLSEKTGCGAQTIHRSLKILPGEDEPKEIIMEELLIVDEISMVGIDTMSAIMMALEMNKQANIVFVGDANQLPSISPGNFLNDMMKSDCANVVVLDQIHRQGENSYISLIANQISNGKVVEIPNNATDIEWTDVNGDNFESTIREFITEYLEEGKDIDDLQVISPMKRGSCGVNESNRIIQQMMAKINGTEERILEIGFNKFHMGDRIIQLENNYEKEVFNGDMGVIIDLGRAVVRPDSDKEEAYINVSFYGDERQYIGDEIEQLKVAFAITVHKYQGSQSKYVVFIMASEADCMMSKELVYTAFTRAEKFLNVFGSKNMYNVAPTKSVVKKRYTNLNKIIQEFKTGKQLMKVL